MPGAGSGPLRLKVIMKFTLLEAVAILAMGIVTIQLESRSTVTYPLILGDAKLSRAEVKAPACRDAIAPERQGSACQTAHQAPAPQD